MRERLALVGGLVLEDGNTEPQRADVLIEGPTIVAVGRDASTRDGDKTVIDVSGHLVVPGLINAHTHSRENLAKGSIDTRPLELWLHEIAVYSEARTLREVYVSAALGAVEALSSGTTSMYELFTNIPVITVGAVMAVLEAYRDVGLRAIVAPSISDLSYHRTIPGLVDQLDDSSLAELDELFPALDGGELVDTVRQVHRSWDNSTWPVRVGIAPVIPERCTDSLLETCRDVADAERLPLHTHLAESAVQLVERSRRSGRSPTHHLDELGLLRPGSTLAHAIWVDRDDIRRLATSGATVVHNPASNMKLGSGVMPLRAMLDERTPVAVGTDGSTTSDNQNMFEALRMAAYVHRLSEPDHESWPAAWEVLSMAWEAGARAMGYGAQLGRVEAGCLADLTVLDCDVESLTPLNDARNQLVMCETGAAVRHVVVDGHVVLRNGSPTRVDASALRAEARDAAHRLARVHERRHRVVQTVTPAIRVARLEAIAGLRAGSAMNDR